MQIKIPLGTEINRNDPNQNQITIKIPNTEYWILGEKRENGNWDTYLIDPKSDYKQLIKENYTTKAFAIFSSTILKTPFPYLG